MSTEGAGGLINNSLSACKVTNSTKDSRLRVCVYGSSSQKTNETFLKAAHLLGVTLAKRGHICVNGAGIYGCMGAVNDGATEAGGEVIGVVHEMWASDDFSFSGVQKKLHIVGGSTLAERKKGLSDNADCFIALPGGTGTWDEIWEVVSERALQMNPRPCALLNVDGYYDGFVQQMETAYSSGILYMPPNEILGVFSTVDDIVNYIETESRRRPIIRKRCSKKKNFGWAANMCLKTIKTKGFSQGMCCGVIASILFGSMVSNFTYGKVKSNN
eukprot:GSMAST32.ASY1.ANO1.2595.1 assembled CDS